MMPRFASGSFMSIYMLLSSSFREISDNCYQVMDLLPAWGLYVFERNTVQARLLLNSGQVVTTTSDFLKIRRGLDLVIDLGLKCEITGGEGVLGLPSIIYIIENI